MRSDAAAYALSAPPTLKDVLALLAAEPGAHTPMAGGTELMVAFNTGRLARRSLLSLAHLRELRFIDVTDTTVTIGSGSTFTDLRQHPVISADLPLLAQAASWTGSIANQNRGTLGGNLANASPAADSSPALLAYEATLNLISSIGRRSLPYCEFHLGYKQTALQPNELLHSVEVNRDWKGYKMYLRKVGTRNAQAISKVALAAIARTTEVHIPPTTPPTIQEIRIAAASLADRPIRCRAAEQCLLHQPLTEAAIAAARSALLQEAAPIDDIRSTAKYRSAVAANLLEDFLRQI